MGLSRWWYSMLLAAQQHVQPALAVHGGQHEHHRQEGEQQAAGGHELEPLEPAGQLSAGEDAPQLAHRHQGAHHRRKDVGILGVEGKDLGLAHLPAQGQGNGLCTQHKKVQGNRKQPAAGIQEFFHKNFLSVNKKSPPPSGLCRGWERVFHIFILQC